MVQINTFYNVSIKVGRTIIKRIETLLLPHFSLAFVHLKSSHCKKIEIVWLQDYNSGCNLPSFNCISYVGMLETNNTPV